MRLDRKDPPRTFVVGDNIKISDCGMIALRPDEQVTFVTEAGAEYDVVRKDWGFYATPSLNGRLLQFGLRAVLIQESPHRPLFRSAGRAEQGNRISGLSRCGEAAYRALARQR